MSSYYIRCAFFHDFGSCSYNDSGMASLYAAHGRSGQEHNTQIKGRALPTAVGLQ